MSDGHCTPKMVTEGARALDLWSDESLREEIDGRRMAELVWKAMAQHSTHQGAVRTLERIRDHADSAEDPAVLAQNELDRIKGTG
jgi:hypothetical protein